jgi:hypothetical protein
MFCIVSKMKLTRLQKLRIVLSPPGMEQFFVETGLEVSDISVKPQPFTDEQKQKVASTAPKYGVELKPDLD